MTNSTSSLNVKGRIDSLVAANVQCEMIGKNNRILH